VAKSSALIEPTPDFTYDPNTMACIGGCRPSRRDTYCLEGSRVGGKILVHNYGHGGAGISMCWGCAQEVVDIVKVYQPQPAGQTVAVLGAGVMGLTAATFLEQLGTTVTIYAKAFSPDTTSDIAGGQWGAASVAYLPGEKARIRIQRILTKSHAEHVRRGAAYGVSPRPNYSMRELEHFELVKNVVRKRTLAHLPFEHLNGPGFAYDTLLVEPPILLPKLVCDLKARPNVRFVQREFRSQAEVMGLAEAIIVNCTGLGSGKIWPDSKLEAIRGQLVKLPAQPTLKYLFSGSGYMFPRADCTIIGGTNEAGQPDCAGHEPRCTEMVDYLRGLFHGVEMLTIPSWIIQDE
jgi:glycine/D-amino acid oxidase-like deaminating enzyme